MSNEAKTQVSIGYPPITASVEIPVEFRKWFRRGKGDVVDRLYKWIHREKKVTLRICCYTLQTTLTMLFRLFARLAESRQFPEVEILILRPDLRRPLRIWDTKNANDHRYWKAVRRDGVLSESVRKLICEEYPRVKFEERFFPFDPCVKAIIANDRVAFFGLYVVEKHRKTNQKDLVALDYLGTKTELTECSEGGVLEELNAWFERTWKTLT